MRLLSHNHAQLTVRAWAQAVVGKDAVVAPHTRLSLCRQLAQAASLSDDELETAAGATASPPSASGGSSWEADGVPSSAPGAQPGDPRGGEPAEAHGDGARCPVSDQLSERHC